MDDHDSSSSTGMIVGMIIGGVLIVALIVLGGGMFFLWRSSPAPPPMAPPPIAVAVDQPVMEVIKGAEPEEVRKARERLIGTWRQGDPKDKRRSWLEFRADGSARWSWSTGEIAEDLARIEAADDNWELQEVANDRLKVRFFANRNKALVYEHQLRLDGEDGLILEGPHKDNPRLIISKDGHAGFTRLRAEKKP